MSKPAADPKASATAGSGEDDRTLGGYLAVHQRPPAFEACDGFPYTVSIETERTGDLRAPVAAFLVFPRWAGTGAGIVGHLETALLWHGTTQKAVVARAEALSLHEVQRLLNEAVVRQASLKAGSRDAVAGGTESVGAASPHQGGGSA